MPLTNHPDNDFANQVPRAEQIASTAVRAVSDLGSLTNDELLEQWTDLKPMLVEIASMIDRYRSLTVAPITSAPGLDGRAA